MKSDDPQQLFPFLRDDPVFQRMQIAKEASKLLLEELRPSLTEEVNMTAQAEVRMLMPRLLSDALQEEVCRIVKSTLIRQLEDLASDVDSAADPADWWKL